MFASSMLYHTQRNHSATYKFYIVLLCTFAWVAQPWKTCVCKFPTTVCFIQYVCLGTTAFADMFL
jgi:hypothetical protein